MVSVSILPGLLLLALCLVEGSATQYQPSQYYSDYPGNNPRSGYSRAWDGGAESRTIWARARSFLPRAADVVGEAIGALLIPTLLVMGFQAIWPRRYHYNVKRSADNIESVSPTDELLEHLSNIYYAATESDDCVQRIVCELGATAKSSLKKGNKDLMISLLGKAASKKYSKLFSKFSEGANTANCSKLGCKLME